MNNILKALAIALFVFGLANCGGGGGGGGETPGETPKGGIAEGATEIQFVGDGPVITWNNKVNNIFRPHSNPDCVIGLSSDSDDKIVSNKLDELEALLAKSKVGKGTQKTTSDDSRLLTITYKNGSSKTFNLDNDLASQDEEVLSNGAQIIEFFESIEPSLTKQDCSTGKGNKGDILTD